MFPNPTALPAAASTNPIEPLNELRFAISLFLFFGGKVNKKTDKKNAGRFWGSTG
jgi:hypothetical protein